MSAAAPVVSISIETSLASFNATLERYMLLVAKLPDEILEKKGRDVSIKLFQGFRAHEWQGSRRGTSGIAWKEFAARVVDGLGIKIREGLEPSQSAPETYTVTQKFTGASGRKRKFNVERKTSLWQKLVYSELMLRQSGIGYLAASFLWFRQRTSQAKGIYYVPNRTGRAIGSVEKGDGFLAISGLTPGLAQVDARYGIVSQALAGAEADMVVYITSHEEALRNAVGLAA